MPGASTSAGHGPDLDFVGLSMGQRGDYVHLRYDARPGRALVDVQDPEPGPTGKTIPGLVAGQGVAIESRLIPIHQR
ncbi:MAG: hypothetical protein OXH72_11835 [Caldilineaceae bacterium]|nr:hypothetical protein [Caldilineaceae bacterium]